MRHMHRMLPPEGKEGKKQSTPCARKNTDCIDLMNLSTAAFPPLLKMEPVLEKSRVCFSSRGAGSGLNW